MASRCRYHRAMSNHAVCSFCQSTYVIANAPILDTGHYSVGNLTSQLGVAQPDSWWEKTPITVKFVADICCGCGRVTMRVEDPAGTWKAYQDMLASGGKPG